MLLDSPEQRWAREAAFHLIQGQTDGIRVAQLAAFARCAVPCAHDTITGTLGT
jgi:hypothetical protein